MSEKKPNCNIEDISESVMLMACGVLSTIPHFQNDTNTQAALKSQLYAMVPNNEALHYLVLEASTRWRKWLGPAELRGILTWRYPTRDGIDGECAETPGMRPEDGEAILARMELEESTQYLELAAAERKEIDEFKTGLLKQITDGKEWK